MPPPIHLPSQVSMGSLVLGRYDLIRELGRGGFGVVWHAKDRELGLDVALKFLPEIVARDPESIEDLKREIRRGLRLTHPGIIRVHNFLRDEQLAAIAMELVDGDTLRTRKRASPEGCLEAAELQKWVTQICDVLTYVHDVAKLVHRDLKPGNLMLTKNGEIKVADFGITSSLSDSLTRMTNRPASGGTLAYMSPQQARGEPPTVTDDVYALGATFYELLTGKPPFFRGDVGLQACAVVPPPMNQRRHEFGVMGKAPIPPAWETVVAAMLAKTPEARPQSMREVRDKLANATVNVPRITSDSAAAQAGAVEGGTIPRMEDTARSRSGSAGANASATNRTNRTGGTSSSPAQQPSGKSWTWLLVVGGMLLMGLCSWLGWVLAEPDASATSALPPSTQAASVSTR